MVSGTQIAAWLKSNGWVVNLLFILMGGYFVAGAVNSVVARSIAVVPTAAAGSAVSSRTPSLSGPEKPEYQAMAARNLMEAQRENLQPEVAIEAPEDEGLTATDTYDPNNLKKCTVPATLRATLVADNNPEWSMAVMYNNNAKEAEVYTINEGTNRISDDATVVEIKSREIIVRRKDHFERCLADDEPPASPLASSPPTPSPSQPEEEKSGDDDGAISKTGDTEWTVSREYLEENVLNNLSRVATQARIVPSFKNGKPNGFKLFSIKPNSLYSKIGLQNGDVVHKINGYEMNSPDKALEIYQKLKDASSISVELTRRGQTRSHSYPIR